jgi:hypothetical protein
VRPHTESVLDGREQGRGQGRIEPVQLANASLATVRKIIAGHRIVVQRKDGTETIKVARVTSIKNGTVNFNDGNKSRAVNAEAILAIKWRPSKPKSPRFPSQDGGFFDAPFRIVRRGSRANV